MKTDKYKIDLANEIKKAIVMHIYKTPEKETVFVDIDHKGELVIWVDGKFKIEMHELLKTGS